MRSAAEWGQLYSYMDNMPLIDVDELSLLSIAHRIFCTSTNYINLDIDLSVKGNVSVQPSVSGACVDGVDNLVNAGDTRAERESKLGGCGVGWAVTSSTVLGAERERGPASHMVVSACSGAAADGALPAFLGHLQTSALPPSRPAHSPHPPPCRAHAHARAGGNLTMDLGGGKATIQFADYALPTFNSSTSKKIAMKVPAITAGNGSAPTSIALQLPNPNGPSFYYDPSVTVTATAGNGGGGAASAARVSFWAAAAAVLLSMLMFF